MIDTHCHIDLYPNPLAVAQRCEKANINTLAMTNLPSHFGQGIRHLRGFRKIRLALGLHPLYAERHLEEYDLFEKYLNETSYVGEVGLDFSHEGIATQAQQLQSFQFVLDRVRNKKKLLSIHSRGAEKQTLSLLLENKIEFAIFHWYTGPASLIKEATEQGYFFSVNPAMIRSNKGRSLVALIPPQKILTETDGPFVQINNKSAEPSDVGLVIKYLSQYWGMSSIEVEATIKSNFSKLVDRIR
jgi:TatD DNase family protein